MCDSHDMTRPSIFAFAGGSEAFAALAAANHQRCLEDPLLNHPFSHPSHPDHVHRLAAYWAEVFGGPPEFSRIGGGQSMMLTIHAGEDAPAEMGERFLQCFLLAADDAGLPDDPEFRAALAAYMRWAVNEVMSYTPGGSQVPSDLPMPRWSWDGLQAR
jgi:hemoglobin